MIIDVSTPGPETAPLTGAIEAALAARIATGSLRVPPYPAIAHRLQVMIAQERTGTRHLAELIKTDPTLSALVLARASSAAFGMPTAPSLDQAIYRLGGQELVQLAVASALGVVATGPGVLSALRRRAWREALIAAGVCEALAIDRSVPFDDAFLAGLLHDFGALVVIAAIEETAEPIPALSETDWWALVQRLHVEAGAHVARTWRLPPALAEVMCDHHRKSGRPLVRLVADVDRIVAQLDAGAELGASPDEEAIVRIAMPRIVEHIASFEQAMPPVRTVVAAPTRVRKHSPERVAWPVDLAVVSPAGTYRATAVWTDGFALLGAAPLRPDWIAQLVVVDGDDRLDMFATIKTCDPEDGGFRMTAQPFALTGRDAATWTRIVERARGA